MGLRFEIFLTLSQIIASIVILVLSRHEKPHAPLRTWLIGYLTGCVATLPFFYWLYPYRQQGVVGVFQEMQLGKLTLSFKRCHGKATVSANPPINTGLGNLADLLRIMLYFFIITWFVLGCVWISNGSSRADAPQLYWSCIALLVMCGLGYAVSFGFLLSALFCVCPCFYCPCLLPVLELVGLYEKPTPPPQTFTIISFP